jgi:hypothetical protein
MILYDFCIDFLFATAETEVISMGKIAKVDERYSFESFQDPSRVKVKQKPSAIVARSLYFAGDLRTCTDCDS